ncbi:hypothetical protein H5410_029685 [Solanum commersonii]|uniref:Uncharacterized protein n=1 Tax=Solanum commersonii TaxID=4109 RepID=A0A9J5YC68_SOLCO|nr:hypothetical protein H5410_029685 [Solanum commersonii]
MDYSTRKLTKWAVYLLRGSFDLENRPFWMKNLAKIRSKFWITKNSIDYSTRQSVKWAVLAVSANWLYI